MAGTALAACKEEQATLYPKKGIVVEKKSNEEGKSFVMASCKRTESGATKSATPAYLKSAAQEIKAGYMWNLIQKYDAKAAGDSFENLKDHPVTAEGNVEPSPLEDYQLACAAEYDLTERGYDKVVVGTYIESQDK